MTNLKTHAPVFKKRSKEHGKHNNVLKPMRLCTKTKRKSAREREREREREERERERETERERERERESGSTANYTGFKYIHAFLLVFAWVFTWCHLKPMHLCTKDVDKALKPMCFARE